ncbi:MAG: hypothetical protein DMG01_29605 [Acidobacteria bacterium]|nr:MAG: hypothetical protein DMG01_29605 [Acidobacteriota bacterium]
MAQEPLDAALLRLAAIIDSSEAAIYSVDLDGTITTWNQASERLFGFPSAAAIGQPLSMIVPPEQEAEEAEVIRRIRGGEGVEHYETVRRRRDGSLFDVALTASPIRDRSGAITGVSKIARDITEQRRHERNGRLLASIVESSDDAGRDHVVESRRRTAVRLRRRRSHRTIHPNHHSRGSAERRRRGPEPDPTR